MNVTPKVLYDRLLRTTAEERVLILRFLIGKRTAAMGRASPELDLFLAELQVEFPGAIDLLGDLRFQLGNELHREVALWALQEMDDASVYRRVMSRFEALFCND